MNELLISYEYFREATKRFRAKRRQIPCANLKWTNEIAGLRWILQAYQIDRR